jgi:uncharacterized protein
MPARAFRLRIKRPGQIAQGVDGVIETLIEVPEDPLRGLALIAHPHPLHGGSLDNKVVYTIARAVLGCGFVAVRPNFRGVGASDGEYDHGMGETEDLLVVARAVGEAYPGLDWWLFGFSFGAYVQHRVAQRLSAQRLVMVGPAVSMYAFEPPAIHTDIIHGAEDELIPLGIVADHAREHGIPLQVIEGADHFFNRKLVALRQALSGLGLGPGGCAPVAE